MSKFSAHMPLKEIEVEISKAIKSSFHNSGREAYICLKMIDKMLPQSLVKLMSNLKKNIEKHLSPNSFVIAGVKCIIDFRIAYYALIGKNRD